MKKTLLITLAISLLALSGCGNKKQEHSKAYKIDEVLTQIQQGKTPDAPQTLIDDAQVMIDRADSGGYQLITSAELKKMMEEKTPFSLLNVSPKGEYLLGLIPMAKNFEIDTSSKSANGSLEWNSKAGSQEKFAKKLGGDRERIVVIYDGGNGELYMGGRADTACLWAKKLGFKKVYKLVGGLKSWKEHNYPITQEAPSCCK